MSGVIAWLLGSKVGRQIAFGLLAAAILALLIWRIYSAGRTREVTQQQIRQLELVRKKIEVDNEISSLPASDRRERLRQWMRE